MRRTAWVAIGASFFLGMLIGTFLQLHIPPNILVDTQTVSLSLELYRKILDQNNVAYDGFNAQIRPQRKPSSFLDSENSDRSEPDFNSLHTENLNRNSAIKVISLRSLPDKAAPLSSVHDSLNLNNATRTMTYDIVSNDREKTSKGTSYLKSLSSAETHLISDRNINFTVTSTFQTERDKSLPRLPTLDDIVQGVYWNLALEKILPQGFLESQMVKWANFSRSTKVSKMEEGCGRMSNRLITFIDGTKACVRYRQNIDQIQGDIFSFFLSQILKINHVPPSTLGIIKGREEQWDLVQKYILISQWGEEKPMVMSQWIENLVPAFIPSEFRGPERLLHPSEELLNKTVEEIAELIQWSDLIIFDYLTANLDRVVNNLFNLQWNKDIMYTPAHNLEKSKDTGLLIFLDNESGLLHGYRLLEKYEPFHKALLKPLCIFRKSTANIIYNLHVNKNVGLLMWELFHNSEPEISNWLPGLPAKNVQILNERISNVYQQIVQCEEQYKSVNS